VSARSYASEVGNGRNAVLPVMIISGVMTFAFAIVFAVLPQLQFAYYGASAHVALETAATLIALLAGFLVFGRLRRRGSVNDLLLACALAGLGLVNLCLLTISALARLLSMDVIVWILLVGRSLCALLFALGAFIPDRRLRRPGLTLGASVAGGSAAVLLTAAMLNWFAGTLTRRLAVALAPTSLKGPGLGVHPELLALQLAATLLYCAATIGFLRRWLRSRDEFLGWLAMAGILAGLSHLNYALYPSPYAPLVHVGDIFRLCFYTTLLVASMREISSYWSALSRAAVSHERERIARDLHDGLAQELACLARNLDSLGTERGEEALGLMRRAVQRAQLESRRVVSTLAEPDAGPIEVALAKAAAEVAERFHIGLQLDLASGVKVSAARGDALVRIAREAVANAGRYSGASQVSLALERSGSRLRLRVSDQGRGFDPAVTSGGFGLVSMRQRARSVGAELTISSVPGEGSEVEAVF
jgi:signal transduction histidine kinase